MWLYHKIIIVISYKFIFFEVESCYSSFYFGEKIVRSEDGHIYCQKSNEIIIISIDNGKIVERLNLCDPYDSLLTFDVSKDLFIITAHKSGLIKLWKSCNTVQLIKKWNSNHIGPISMISIKEQSQLLCSAESSGIICVWDTIKNCAVCNIKEERSISYVTFYPYTPSSLIFVITFDNTIRCWDFSTGKCIKTFSGHISQVTYVSFDDQNFEYMASVSTDKVLILWRLSDSTHSKILPLYESLQGVFFLTSDQIKMKNFIARNTKELLIIAVTITGKIFVINCAEMKILLTTCLTYFDKKTFNDSAVSQILYCKTRNELMVVNCDHTLLIYDICKLVCSKALFGKGNKILDLCFIGETDQYLAVATNNSHIIVYDVSNMNSIIATEHTNTVMTISGLKNYLLSAGRDLTIIVWKLDSSSFSIKCIQKCFGHKYTIGSISLACKSLSMFSSVSEDGCLKIWISSNVPDKNRYKRELSFKLKESINAHEKPINCTTFARNNQILATASQDTYIKIWSCNNIKLIATLYGHKRGVWSVKFSPVDQILISASSDCSMRVWSLSNFVCLLRFDELFPVLRIEFLRSGKKFLSTSSKGLIKVWNINSPVCICSLEKHKKEVWALSVKKDGSGFFSGGGDKNLVYWREETSSITKDILKENDASAHKYKLLSKVIQKGKHIPFPCSSFLNQPLLSAKIIKEIINLKSTYNISINKINDDQVNSVQNYVKAWNTNNQYCKISQYILAIVATETPRHQNFIKDNIKFIEDVNLYSKKHYKRISSYVKQLKFLNFLVNCM